jgi:hypothetical protein
MHVAKLRIGASENGLVPAGEYFKRLAEALREANEKQARAEQRAARSRALHHDWRDGLGA